MARPPTKASLVSRFQRTQFETKLRGVGQLDYFLLTVQKRSTEGKLLNDRSVQWNFTTQWRKEATERWGFHKNWMPSDTILIPNDCPAPVFRDDALNRTLASQNGTPRIYEPHSDQYAEHVAQDNPSFAEHIRWAQKMLGADIETIPLRQIPSKAHLKMLRFADKETERFYKWVQDLDAAEDKLKQNEHTFVDDNAKLFKIFDAVIADLERRIKKEEAAAEKAKSTVCVVAS